MKAIMLCCTLASLLVIVSIAVLKMTLIIKGKRKERDKRKNEEKLIEVVREFSQKIGLYGEISVGIDFSDLTIPNIYYDATLEISENTFRKHAQQNTVELSSKNWSPMDNTAGHCPQIVWFLHKYENVIIRVKCKEYISFDDPILKIPSF